MPRVVEFQSTPNPNAIKCVLDGPVPVLAGSAGVRSYREASAAAGDPVAAAMFAIAGVRNVLIVGNWITVGKDEAATWKTLKPQIERVLQ
jgi:hypothetical protein